MALAKALTELERGAKAAGGKAFRGLHLKYLEAYDEHASERLADSTYPKTHIGVEDTRGLEWISFMKT